MSPNRRQNKSPNRSQDQSVINSGSFVSIGQPVTDKRGLAFANDRNKPILPEKVKARIENKIVKGHAMPIRDALKKKKNAKG